MKAESIRERRRRAAAIVAGTALCVVLAGAAALALWPRPSPPLPVLGRLPPFELTSEQGRPLRLDDLRGRVFGASFLFTRCETICPVIVAKLERIQAATADLGPALALVSFSVDPEHDTPPVLAAYAREHHADPRRWTFLTGAQEAIQRTVVEGFKEVLERTPGRGPEGILHGSHVVLVDGAGRIRGYYDAAELDCVERFTRDARRLVGAPDWGDAVAAQ